MQIFFTQLLSADVLMRQIDLLIRFLTPRSYHADHHRLLLSEVLWSIGFNGVCPFDRQLFSTLYLFLFIFNHSICFYHFRNK